MSTTVDLRREDPRDNVNRILAIETLVKHYPIDVVEQINANVVHSWTELDEQDNEIPVKQIDLAYVLFGMPTPELRHLMTKLKEHVLKMGIIPTDTPSPEVKPEIPEVRMINGKPETNRQRLDREYHERIAREAEEKKVQDDQVEDARKLHLQSLIENDAIDGKIFEGEKERALKKLQDHEAMLRQAENSKNI